MSPALPGKFGDDPAERRQKRLQWIAWAATILPVAAFLYLTWESIDLQQRNLNMEKSLRTQRQTKSQLEREIAALQQERTRLSRDKAIYRNLAGVRVVFYRAQDKEVVSAALNKLGLQAELRTGVRTISKQADTLAYGPEVSASDCKAVATALVQTGFPLRRIAPAENVRDARMLQIYASARTATDAPVYTPQRIEQEPVCAQASR